jgi:hypothetical protein
MPRRMNLNGERTKACDEFMRENDEQAKVTAFGRLMFIHLLFSPKALSSKNNQQIYQSSIIHPSAYFFGATLILFAADSHSGFSKCRL